MVKIESKIVAVEVVKKSELNPDPIKLNNNPLLKRPKELEGTTYKLTPGNSENALFLTINDIIINGKRRPYEIFINTKNSVSIQWTNVFTRLVSAIFRRESNNENCDVAFLIEELLTIYDHSDGFFNGEFTSHPINMPSTVAYIGYFIRKHLIKLGLYTLEENTINNITQDQIKNAEICPKCGQKTYIKTDCWVCLECNYSKCS